LSSVAVIRIPKRYKRYNSCFTNAPGQAYLTWQGAGTPGLGGRLAGTFQYTGGTGRYQGIRGDNTFVGVTQVNWNDGTSSGYATWNR
jgi:hypothetical protein